ncbi:3'-5' exonuclease [Acetivibrio mesophilus]|uniref:DNA 3'-5' helicase n=1 Tax=Acetivibrio mesophilus TaxID=2487273 RepID=A0A4Q0I870_9FIRM|nr:3'-5' exonuclease [Acetivibrio mesophilus]ODM26305.1 hypothetical protein A7W90_08750 [Clostridium sp. Bc-iso-3]RXE60641.1 hypothetical protein EFD62_01580 [Acetivibrio mesophilus]HHV30357.1 UvrD-helicase domain-containing protein [Clostridium sp.]
MNINIAITRSYLRALGNLPKSVQKKAHNFFEKFRENPEAESINYEKINAMRDDKVRTVRIDQKYRAIVLHPPEGNLYLFVHIDNHDEAMNWAKNKVFDVNHYSSALQVVDMDIVDRLRSFNESVESTEQNKTSITDRYSEDELISIGIPKMIIPVLKVVHSAEELVKYVRGYVSDDIFEILEFCVEGLPINEIKECFDIEDAKEKPSIFEVINKKVNRPYIKVLSNEEEISSILDNPIDFWRVFIHPKQQKIVEGNYSGSFQIKGAAGTGKTVVAMHRAKYLAEHVYNSEDDLILYTTFSKKLAKSVEYNLKNMCDLEVLKRIEVVHLYSWIAKYMKRINVSFDIIDDEDRKTLIGYAIDKAGYNRNYTVQDIIHEIDIVLKYNQITDIESYLKVSRNGAYKKLGRNQRKEVWSIISEYFELLHQMDKQEWWMVFRDLTNIIKKNFENKYRAVIIDEAQDFGMPEYRLIRSIIKEKENDIFIVGDIRQKIYPTDVNFSKCGINILGNRTRQLLTNYRNTFEITQLADQIISNIEFKDFDETLISNKRANAIIRGDKPFINAYTTKEDEAKFVAEEIRKIVDSGIEYNEIALVSRTNDYLKSIIRLLDKHGVKSTHLEDLNSIHKNNIYYGTMHSIKGFEFKVIFVVGVNKSLIPLKSQIEKMEFGRQREEFIKLERSLLYVAITRARDRVYITGSPDISDWIKGEYK